MMITMITKILITNLSDQNDQIFTISILIKLIIMIRLIIVIKMITMIR